VDTPTPSATRQSIVAQILEWVRYALTRIRTTETLAGKAKRPRAQTGNAQSEADALLVDNDALRLLLEKLRDTDFHVSASMIQMVQLGDARKAFGEQWAQVAESAMSIAETMLKHRLDQSDIFSRYKDYGFVVVFTKLNSEMATQRAEAVSAEISELLLKKPELKGAFAAQQVTAPVRELTGPGDGDALATAARELEDRGRSKAERNGSNLITLNPRTKKAAKCVTQPASAPSADKSPQSVKNPGRGAPALTTPAAPAAKKPSEPSLVAMYQPVLIQPKKMVGISLGVPKRRGPDGEWLTGQRAYTRGTGGELNQSLDLFMCKQVVADLKQATKAGKPAIVALMVRLESLSTSTKISEMLETLTNAESSRLILEIVVHDANTPVARIQEIFGRLRRITNNIVLQVDVSESAVAKYAAVGVTEIGCCLTANETGDEASPKNAERVKAFGARTKKAGLRCRIYGVSEAETFSAAVESGAFYVGGPIIGPLVDGPVAPQPFTGPAASTATASAGK